MSVVRGPDGIRLDHPQRRRLTEGALVVLVIVVEVAWFAAIIAGIVWAIAR